MERIRIDIMVKYLKHKAAVADKKLFNDWHYGLITTNQCIRQFRINNDITERMPILVDDFEYWLNSLGYWRKEHGKEKQ